MKSFSRLRLSFIYVIIIIALLALVSTYSYVASRNVEHESSAIVNDAIPITTAVNNLLTDLINQETGLRGYELVGDEQYLQPFTAGKEQLDKDLATIRAFEDTYPTLRLLVETQAVPIINNLQNHYNNQINLIKSGNLEEAKTRIINGKTLMDRYRLIHSSMLSDIDHITADAYEASKKAGKYSRAISLIGSFIGIVIGGLSVVIFSRANQAEKDLRSSEETYRYMAESLETQNEEIIAQQEEQQVTLAKLSEREHELELISSYQEKLTGYFELNDFLGHSLPALLDSLLMDSALVVMKREDRHPAEYEVIYAVGYPLEYVGRAEAELFGPAKRVFDEGAVIVRSRMLSGNERGLHESISNAVDQYFPLFDDKQKVIGFLLLTEYQQTSLHEDNQRLVRGLIRQFGLAFHTQVLNEERRRQSVHLEELNDQLIKEKQFIEDQRDLIESILEAAHEGMMMCDSQGVVLFANQRMERYFKLHRHIGRNLVESCYEIARETAGFTAVASSIQTMLEGGLPHLTQRFSFGTEETLQHAELYATVVGGEAVLKGYLFVFRDRTEEERVDEMKNEFISIVSHELRTPLASVLGFIEILIHRDLPQEKQKKYMDTIHKEALRLSNLINDFLDLQRMESGKQVYHFSPVDLVPAVQEVVEQWQNKEHRIIVRQQQPELWVRADADRLRQVFHNLISNAIKYSPGADRVDIYLATAGGKASISVQDYGLGIPEDAHEHLFTKFFRVDNSDRRQIGGTGLGLAIVKEIIEGHAGRVSFSSEMGVGTTFTLELDLFELSSIDGRIVIFEDDDNLAKLIQVALNKLGLPSMQFRSAEEGILALERESAARPLLFIVDILLEGTKTGWDFLAELYRHPVHCQTPVIVSTALDPPHDYQEKEIEKYMKKPFTMERLVQVAQRLLDSHGHHSYVFPAQDKEYLSTVLERSGIEVSEMKENLDMIEVEIKKASPPAAPKRPTGQ